MNKKRATVNNEKVEKLEVNLRLLALNDADFKIALLALNADILNEDSITKAKQIKWINSQTIEVLRSRYIAATMDEFCESLIR